MEFTKFYAGRTAYGTGNKAEKKQLPHVNFNDPQLDINLKNKDSEENSELIRTLIFLSLCHTIVIDTRKNCYSASSPDELALVNAAK